MSRSKSDRGRATGLRTWRQKMDLDGAVIVGPQSLNEIVYCYRFPSRPGRVKIGYSSRGLRRVAEQSTAFPEKPVIVFVIHDRRARAMEEAFHIALADRQSDVMGTEWFDADLGDLLRVSPILRKATGRDLLARRARWAVTALLIAVCLAMAPATAAAMAAFAKGIDAGVILATLRDYPGRLLSGGFRVWHDYWSYAFSRETSSVWPVLGLLPLPVLAWLPWKRWRRQAV